MKHYSLLFFGVILLSSYRNPEPRLFNEGPVVIQGHIDNTVGNVVLFTALELTGRVEHIAKIDSNGNFNFSVEVLGSHDNFLSYGGDLVTIFLEPGDSLYLTADGTDFENTLIYSGDNGKFNQCLKMFFIEFEKALISEKFFEKKTDLAPNEFKRFAFYFFKAMDLYADSIYQVVQPQEETKEWMYNYTKYRLAEDLLEYGMHHSNDLSKDYYDFENQFLDQDNYSMHCSQYYEDFIEKYYFEYVISKVDGFEEVATKIQDQTYEGLDVLIDFLHDHLSNSTAKNLILTRFMNDFISYDYKIVDSIYNKYSQIVKDVTCQNFILQRIDNAKSLPVLVKTLNDLVSLEFAGKIFQEIKEECSGKVLYIDIWGTWCGGCLNSFPYSNKLYEELQDKNIEFVYLCVHSDESDWQKVIRDYNLKGKHYLLTEDQKAVLSEKFNCYGVPRYIIIDKGGTIVDDVAKNPYSGALKDELLTLINK